MWAVGTKLGTLWDLVHEAWDLVGSGTLWKKLGTLWDDFKLAEWDDFKQYPYDALFAKMLKPALLFEWRQ